MEATLEAMGGAFAELQAASRAGLLQLTFVPNATAEEVAAAMERVKPQVVYAGSSASRLTGGLPAMTLRSKDDPAGVGAASVPPPPARIGAPPPALPPGQRGVVHSFPYRRLHYIPPSLKVICNSNQCFIYIKEFI